jgi:hypothetical protein
MKREYRLVIVTEGTQVLAVHQTETKVRTAPPRPNNAFGQGRRRLGYFRLLSELPADLPTKLFANAKRVRLAARCACDAEQIFRFCRVQDDHPDSDPGISGNGHPPVWYVTAVKKVCLQR